MARKRKRKTVLARRGFSRRRNRVVSSRVVFGDVDSDSELVVEVDTVRHGVVRGGRGRSA